MFLQKPLRDDKQIGSITVRGSLVELVFTLHHFLQSVIIPTLIRAVNRSIYTIYWYQKISLQKAGLPTSFWYIIIAMRCSWSNKTENIKVNFLAIISNDQNNLWLTVLLLLFQCKLLSLVLYRNDSFFLFETDVRWFTTSKLRQLIEK
jgi:hypothetical protein